MEGGGRGAAGTTQQWQLHLSRHNRRRPRCECGGGVGRWRGGGEDGGTYTPPPFHRGGNSEGKGKGHLPQVKIKKGQRTQPRRPRETDSEVPCRDSGGRRAWRGAPSRMAGRRERGRKGAVPVGGLRAAITAPPQHHHRSAATAGPQHCCSAAAAPPWRHRFTTAAGGSRAPVAPPPPLRHRRATAAPPGSRRTSAAEPTPHHRRGPPTTLTQ